MFPSASIACNPGYTEHITPPHPLTADRAQIDLGTLFLIETTVNLDEVLILINGKNSPLMGRSRAEVLQQMPAASIDKIEIITNPSAKYRPDGTSGIINIVMKKNVDSGTNGSTTLNVGNRGRINGSVRLNYRPDGFNLHGSYNVRKDNRNRINTDSLDRTDVTSVLTFYRENATANAEPLSHSVVLGLDYECGKKTSAGIAAN